MSLASLFIHRPVATVLLALGLGMAGMTAYTLLPVSPFPNIDIPTIVVSASMPGASPETMASSVATPLERHLGSIAGVDEMTSRSNINSTQIVLQFDIDRNIDGAARDVQAAINAARADLPAALRSNPTYRKFNPADFPIMILAMTSKTLSPGQIYDQASNIVQQKLSQISGVGDVSLNGASLPAIRIELNPRALYKYGIGLADVRAAISAANANTPKGDIQQGDQTFQVYANDVATAAIQYKTLIIAYRNGSAVRLQDVAEIVDGVENVRNLGTFNGAPAVLVNTRAEVSDRPAIHLDNAAGARAVVDHLVATGRRHIVHISGPQGNIDAEERAAAFTDALKRHRDLESIVIQGDFYEESGAAAVATLIDAGRSFDAIFAGNDMMAIGALEALRARGHKVPEDIAVAGFDDVPLASHLGVTTVRVRIAELGERAIERLIRMLEGEEDSIGEELHAPELVVRGSTVAGASVR